MPQELAGDEEEEGEEDYKPKLRKRSRRDAEDDDEEQETLDADPTMRSNRIEQSIPGSSSASTGKPETSMETSSAALENVNVDPAGVEGPGTGPATKRRRTAAAAAEEGNS